MGVSRVGLKMESGSLTLAVGVRRSRSPHSTPLPHLCAGPFLPWLGKDRNSENIPAARDGFLIRAMENGQPGLQKGNVFFAIKQTNKKVIVGRIQKNH